MVIDIHPLINQGITYLEVWNSSKPDRVEVKSFSSKGASTSYGCDFYLVRKLIFLKLMSRNSSSKEQIWVSFIS